MRFLYFVPAGLLGGILAGMGMGGGTLTLPILVLVLGTEQLTAQYANLIAFLPSGAAALALHVKNGLVKGKNIGYLLAPALIACAFTSALVQSIDADILKRLFGVFLCIIAVMSMFAKIFTNFNVKKVQKSKKAKKGVFTF